MDIKEIQSLLDNFVLNGGNIDSLTQNDKLYRLINDSDIFVDGKKLTLSEKFELAGHKRTKRTSALERLQKFFDDFIANGGKIEDIKKGTPEYTIVKNATIYLANGRRATMNEKYELCGLENPIKRIVSVDEIKRRLQEFVDNGGNVDDLGVEDELYQLVKSINSRRTLEENFKICGQIRKPKKTSNIWDDLSREAHEYLANGGNLHVERKKLPFFETLHTARRSYFRKFGHKISAKDALARVGITGYSDIYYNFGRIYELEKYKDENGYVDSYRKDPSLDGLIDRLAVYLDMPISVVVQLVGDQKLKKSLLNTDTISYISNEVKKYVDVYGGFESISEINPQLYNRLNRLKRIVKTESGSPVSTKELVEMLGTRDEKDVFKDSAEITEIDFENDILPLIGIAEENNNQISAKQISHSLYRRILDHATRSSMSISDYFAQYGIKYTDSKPMQTFTHIKVDKFPYIDEMKARRNTLFKEYRVKNNDKTKEEYFEVFLEICKQAYQEYKPLINIYGLNEDFDSSPLKK